MELLSVTSPVFRNNKAFKVGLRLVWACGFFLILVSFYATTQMLPSQFLDHSFTDSGSPTITIFAAPRPFSGSVGARQALAVRSWLGLSADIAVVLFSQDPSVFAFAGAFSSRVSVEPNIDFTFLSTPFFHSMVERSLASSSDISVLVDAEVILLPDLISTLDHVYKLDQDWFLVASTRKVSNFPFQLDADGKYWLTVDSRHIRTEKLQGSLLHRWQWNYCEERMLLAWNNGDFPLHTGVLPPFLTGKGLHNHWVINEALLSDFRFVFDASGTISNFHLNGQDDGAYKSTGDSKAHDVEKKIWENLVNSYLGALYGSLSFHEANYSSLVKLVICDGRYLFVNMAEDIVYPVGYQRSLSNWTAGFSTSRRKKKIFDCVDYFKSLDRTKNCSMKDQLKSSAPLSLPFSLKFLLSTRADQNNTIALAIAGYSYKDMLMSWVCRLRRLLISNFLVCALDPEMYEFSVVQGLPVFKDSFAPTNISFDDCHFGTECFQRVTKVKSRVVLQILKLGYHVLLSDVDVYWFKNPLPVLNTFGPAVLVAQSDEYNITGPINLPRRLNSGFYYAHSDALMIAALEKVVKHAAASNLSEQPSFYDTLCGEGGANRVGDNRCLEPETLLTVHFLDRDRFPNGAYQGLWDERNVKAACLKKGCFILHSNWISGRTKKLERQVLSGLWEYDISKRMCLQSWQSTKYARDWLLAMLKRFIPLFGFIRTGSRRRKALGDASMSLNLNIQLKDITVRVVHAGGREELYHNAIPASQLLKKYPGMCVARPEVFKNPNESILSPEEKLLPGHKYYIIPSTTVQKVKRKHSKKKGEEPAGCKEGRTGKKLLLLMQVEISQMVLCVLQRITTFPRVGGLDVRRKKTTKESNNSSPPTKSQDRVRNWIGSPA
ncbi:hypothetical protein RJ639_000368 [Escallonia herrerae]|uniref:Nucleotide-diphospho-sugar transferase domain-containing protein n=1 Tax=Escallonia herrerae TaxID=1293975 RepID=A0AA89BM33_9ASTE|nr:hypothetical protein RJ639_000368 [Escallonia herrerae]